MIDKIKKDLINYRISIIVIIIYLIIMQVIFGTVCPIKAIFHANCPGCGLTHATIYMFTGNINKAIKENYTVFLWWILIVMFVFDRYIHKFKINIIPAFVIIVGIITLTRYFIIILL